ncbi:MAG: hypothetical protein V4500_06990 [Pseudomonadota bacterium]
MSIGYEPAVAGVLLSSWGSSRHNGLGDIEIGVRYRFLQETDSRPMAGISPLVVISTGNAEKESGNDATQVFLPVWLQKRWVNGSSRAQLPSASWR